MQRIGSEAMENTVTRPVGVERAPYFAELVDSSCTSKATVSASLGGSRAFAPLNRRSRYAIWAKLRRENVAEVGALPVRLQDEIICCRKRLEPSQYPVPHLRMIAQLKTDNGLNGGDLIFQAMRKLFYRKLPKMLLVLQSF